MAVFRDRSARRSPHFDRVSLAKAGRIEDAPHGYLWCRDVPLARTGTMDYAPFEVPEIPPAPGQRVVTVERTTDEVFHPDAIASFRGMPLTDDHPDSFVTAENYHRHAIGEIHDPRRGEGEHADCLVADLLVKDLAAIALIKSRRKRELSCGYDAAYADIRPGYGRQINIRGNHVSLVDAGRAGPRIAIRDRFMPKLQAVRRRAGMLDALFAALKSEDPAVAQRQRRALDEAMGESEPDDKGDGHTVNVTVHAPPPDKGPDNPEPSPGDTPDPEKGKTMDEEQIKALVNTAVEQALAASAEATAAATAKAVEEATQPLQAKIDELTGAMEDMADPEDVGMQDAAMRAEVLAPGLARPTRDAKPGSKAHRDGLSVFKRAALKHALTTEAGRAAVTAVAGHARADIIDRASPDAVDVMFTSASQFMADRAASATAATATALASATSGYVRDDKGSVVRTLTPADMQAHADAFYGRGRKAS